MLTVLKLYILIWIIGFTSVLTQESRVVNGIPTTTDDWPWMVSVRADVPNFFNIHLCGGTVIRKTKPAAILTAAHCVTWLNNTAINVTLWIDIGRDDVSESSDLNDTEANDIYSDSSLYESYKMDYFIKHPDYPSNPNASFPNGDALHTFWDHDVAIIFIDDELDDSQPIITLNPNTDLFASSNSENYDKLIGIGYGAEDHISGTPTDTLQYTNLYFMNESECNIGIDQYYIEYGNYTEWEIYLNKNGYDVPDDYPYDIVTCNECILCVYGIDTDTCYGDSGGPLVYGTNKDNAIQVGIVSFGFDCGYSFIPAQYTNISNYYQWIQQTLNDSLTIDDCCVDSVIQINMMFNFIFVCISVIYFLC